MTAPAGAGAGRIASAILLATLLLPACGGESAEEPTSAGSASSAEARVAFEPISPAAPSYAGDAASIQRVVIVSIDTLRADRVGCYGDEDAETPTLDALASAGVRFEAAISPTPVTLPSHATLLTGLDPPAHGVRHNGLFRLAPDVPTLAERARQAGFATGAFVSAYVLDRQFGLDRGFDVYDDQIGVNSPGHAGPSVPTRKADRTVDAALGWVATAPDRFVLFVHLYDPHADHSPPEPYRTRFGDARLYDAEVAFADAEIGRLLSGIAQRWPSGTLVAVTSDHGESFGEHGEPTHSLSIYEATQHVPLIVAGPGVPAGQVVSEVARLADVAPTVVDLLDLQPAEGGGESLRSLWEGASGPPRVAWVETLATQFDFGWSPLLGVRTASHKYIRAPRPQLFELGTDPDELEDLAEREPELVRRLDALVGEYAAGRPIVPNTDLDADERAQLEALGYVTEGAPRGQAELGVVGGTDPKDEMHLLTSLFEGMNLLARRRWDEALEKLDVMGNRSLELAILRGQAALAAHKLGVAREAAEAALRFAPGRGQPHVLLGQVEEAAGHPEKARARYEHAIEIEPGQGASWLGLGRLAEAEGKPDEARAAYQRATEARIFEAEAVWRQAALEIERGDTTASRRLLLTLPQAELRQPGAVLRLAQAEQAAGRGEIARIRVAGALRAFPDDISLLAMQAIFLELDGDNGGALRVRRLALEAQPGNVQVQQIVSRHLAHRGQQLDEALALAEAALAQAGREPPALATLAQVRLAQGRSADALALVEEALPGTSGPIRTGLLLRRAEGLAGLGRGPEARAVLASAGQAAEGVLELKWDVNWTQQRVAGLLVPDEEPASL